MVVGASVVAERGGEVSRCGACLRLRPTSAGTTAARSSLLFARRTADSLNVAVVAVVLCHRATTVLC